MPQIIDRLGPSAPVFPTQREQSHPIETPKESTAQSEAKTAGQEAPKVSADSDRLVELARREQRLRRETQRVAQEKTVLTQLQTQLQGMKQENDQLRNWYQRFYREPVQVLNEAGVHGDVITQSLLNQPNRESVMIRQLQGQIAQLSQQNQQITQKIDQDQKEQYKQALSQIKNDTQLLIDGEASYEAIKANGQDGVDAVVELIEQTYLKDNKLMSVKAAADEVENYLIEEATKLAGLNKVKEKLSQAPKDDSAQGANQAPQRQLGQQTTLSNRSIPAPLPRVRTTEKDRIARAIDAFNNVRRQ